MPELPEVQATVDGVRKYVRGRKITGLWVDWPKTLKDPLDQRHIRHDHVDYFTKYLKGEKILNVRRRGKNILFDLTNGKMMLLHQKMSGHLLMGNWEVRGKKVLPVSPAVMKTDSWNGYIRLIFHFDRGPMMAFSDLRRFGKAVIGTKREIENLPELKDLGPEPLAPSFDFKRFQERLAGEKRKIKQVLMDQTVIAGIGNIYSDDILWRAKIHPFRAADRISEKERQEIFRAMKSVLQKAKRLRGTSSGDYRTPAGKAGSYFDSRFVYQREGEPCKRCGAKIARIKMGGRSAHYCPKCQK